MILWQAEVKCSLCQENVEGDTIRKLGRFRCLMKGLDGEVGVRGRWKITPDELLYDQRQRRDEGGDPMRKPQ